MARRLFLYVVKARSAYIRLVKILLPKITNVSHCGSNRIRPLGYFGLMMGYYQSLIRNGDDEGNDGDHDTRYVADADVDRTA